jgi:hypothetical protein
MEAGVLSTAECIFEDAQRSLKATIAECIASDVEEVHASKKVHSTRPSHRSSRSARSKATIAALKAKKLPVPSPNSGGVASGKFVARVPKTVHAQLATRAKAEGVSLNTLVLTFIAQGLGSSSAKPRARGAA